MAVKPLHGPAYHVHMESNGEKATAQQLMLGCPERLVVTQPVKFAWNDGTFKIEHTPDLLFFDTHSRLLVDVTTQGRGPARQEGTVLVHGPRRAFRAPLDRVLQWELTALACEALGWRYEVRTELPAQAIMNLAALAQWIEAPTELIALADRILQWMPAGGCSIHRALARFRGTRPPWDAVKHLVQFGSLNLDWVNEIRSTTWLHKEPQLVDPGNLLTGAAWRQALTCGA